jgi:putative transposase
MYKDNFKTDGYQHRRHNKNLLMVHLIFVTKYRKQLFYDSFRNDIKQYMLEICKKYHWYIKSIETDLDHIHILLQYSPMDSITNIVSILKQRTTYLAWRNYSDCLKHYYWKRMILWSDGYFAASIGQVSQTTIEYYIENQG